MTIPNFAKDSVHHYTNKVLLKVLPSVLNQHDMRAVTRYNISSVSGTCVRGSIAEVALEVTFRERSHILWENRKNHHLQKGRYGGDMLVPRRVILATLPCNFQKNKLKAVMETRSEPMSKYADGMR